MKQIDKFPNPDAKFDLYFLAYDSTKSVSSGAHRSDRQGVCGLSRF